MVGYLLKLNVLKDIQENRKIELPSISIRLIFRWLYVEKIIDEKKDLTELGKILENELKPLILYWQDLPFKSSAKMVDTLKNGNESFSKIFDKPYFDFLEENPPYRKLSKEMSRYYTVDYSTLIRHLDLSDEIVCDIGGGSGELIKIIKSAYPNINTIIADKFVNSEKDIKIDFFKSFKIQSNVFLLSRVLHDWSDAKALIILENIAKNMNHSSTLYLFETIVPLNVKVDKGITLSFHLLNFVGGYERTFNDFKILLDSVNLKIDDIYEEENLISLIKVGKK